MAERAAGGGTGLGGMEEEHDALGGGVGFYLQRDGEGDGEGAEKGPGLGESEGGGGEAWGGQVGLGKIDGGAAVTDGVDGHGGASFGVYGPIICPEGESV